MTADVDDDGAIDEPTPEPTPDPTQLGDAEIDTDPDPTDAVVMAPESMEAELERLIGDVERLSAERDQHLDEARRLAAEFANFRKQTDKRHAEMAGQAGAGLLERLLPVLDACDSAAQQGADDVVPIRDMFRDFLGNEGLAIVDEIDAPFDPLVHEAVLREEGDPDQQVVTEILRSGYVLNGRVLRAAMVKVRG
ncbi:MAG: nucleotide exchange factor GrpE [Acidimicrobiales bacterium]